jgi:hypothetical protein
MSCSHYRAICLADWVRIAPETAAKNWHAICLHMANE